MSEESLLAYVRRQYDGKPAESYLSLGEVMRLRCKGFEINIADLANRLRNGQQDNMPVLKIVKKRAAYECYLAKARKKAQEKSGPPLPEVKLIDITLPTLPERK